MTSTISATELARRLSDVLNRVRYAGESFLVERNGEQVALIGPASAPRQVTLRQLVEWVGALKLPGDGFADDLERIQQEQTSAEPPAWPC